MRMCWAVFPWRGLHRTQRSACECWYPIWCPCTSDGQSRNLMKHEQRFQMEGKLMTGLTWMLWPRNYAVAAGCLLRCPMSEMPIVASVFSAQCSLYSICICVLHASLFSLFHHYWFKYLPRSHYVLSCGQFPGSSQTLTLCTLYVQQETQTETH